MGKNPFIALKNCINCYSAAPLLVNQMLLSFVNKPFRFMFGQPIYFFLRLILQLIFSRMMKKLFNRSRHFAAFLMGLLLAIPAIAQPPAGAVAAKPNIIYYAGGKCDFYDVNSNLLLSLSLIHI